MRHIGDESRLEPRYLEGLASRMREFKLNSSPVDQWLATELPPVPGRRNRKQNGATISKTTAISR